MAATLSDIARRVGVTKTTVAYVLNRKRSGIRISEETRQRVLSVARELNYRPSFSARALVTGRTNTIGFQCGQIISPHYNELADMALREVEDRGYHLLISVTPWRTGENDLDCLQTLMGRGVDGVILFGGSAFQPDSPLYRQILAEKYPLVTMSDEVEGLSSVASDWQPGMEEAISRLADKGHRRVAYVRSRSVNPAVDGKLRAFDAACRGHGTEPEVLVGRSVPEDSRQCGREFARRADRPTAVIYSCDHGAMGFLRGLRDEKVVVPDEVAVIGIDGTEAGAYCCPSLTTIAQDRRQMIHSAVEMVLAIIDKKEPPGRRVHLATKLIVRESA
ncbi:MAG: LacI family transcriptional regulator [Phycisphaerae bacterium]|nr:LacI family transcriptional regulator [Phycisphaerae bacterium]